MSSEIGDLLRKLRQDLGFTLRQVCHGVCSVSQMGKIESNQLSADYFVIDRLYGRLGKPVDRLEYVLPLETYQLYEERFLIQNAVCYRNYEQAWNRLDQFEKRKEAQKPLHRQFIAANRAQILWLQGESQERVLRYLKHAIKETILENCEESQGLVFSAEELVLCLFRWEVSQGSEAERPQEELMRIGRLRYLAEMDTAERVKWIPYLALLMAKVFPEKEGMLEHLTKEALELLKEEGRILFMPEILQQYSGILKRRKGNTPETEMLQEERKSLLWVEEEYGIHLEQFRLFCHTIRRFEIDSEVIRKERKAVGSSQEKFSEGICTPESLGRIETGKRTPHRKHLERLLGQIGRERPQIDTVIKTVDYELLWMKREFNGMMQFFEYEKAEAILDQMERKMDPKILKNEQFLRGERIKISYQLGKRAAKSCLEELEQVLKLTVDLEHTDVFQHELTVEENSIMNEIAYIYDTTGENEKAISIWKRQLQGLEDRRVNSVFCILEWELAVENLASMLEENKEPANAIVLCDKKLVRTMEAGRGNAIGQSLMTKGCAMEGLGKIECLRYFSHGIRLLKLYKMENRYRDAIAYLKREEFAFRDQWNAYM